MIDNYLDAATRHADGLTAQLDNQNWRPSRAHVEQARNTIRNLVEKVRSQPAIDATNHHNALKCPHCNPDGLEFEKPVFIPNNDHGVKPGYHTRRDIVDLLRKHKSNPDAVHFIADMME